jgi:competence protein ComGC
VLCSFRLRFSRYFAIFEELVPLIVTLSLFWVIAMNEPERPINTFYAFCSLVLPGLGQLLQKRVGTAVGFFTLFILSGFLPVLIVSLLFRDRFSYQPFRVHLLHLSVFGGLFFLFMLAVFWSVLDAAAWKPGKKPKEKPFAAFVEFLVVIVIVGVLVILLLPAVPAARESDSRMQCQNNMKQIMLAFHAYHDVHHSFPPAYTVDENGKPLHSWRVLILPYIGCKALDEQIRLDEPWDSEYNRQFHTEAPDIFRCSSHPFSPEDFQCPTCHHEHVSVLSCSFYSVIGGAEAAFVGSQTKSPTKETIFLVERREPVNWMEPLREMTFETASKGINVDAMGISSFHVEGANCAFGDSRVDFLSNTVEGKVLRKMLTLNAKTEE